MNLVQNTNTLHQKTVLIFWIRVSKQIVCSTQKALLTLSNNLNKILVSFKYDKKNLYYKLSKGLLTKIKIVFKY